jgi:hypothetical protein
MSSISIGPEKNGLVLILSTETPRQIQTVAFALQNINVHLVKIKIVVLMSGLLMQM